jgi:hypothetical protein
LLNSRFQLSGVCRFSTFKGNRHTTIAPSTRHARIDKQLVTCDKFGSPAMGKLLNQVPGELIRAGGVENVSIIDADGNHGNFS